MGLIAFAVLVTAVLIYELATTEHAQSGGKLSYVLHPFATFKRMGKKGKILALAGLAVFALGGTALAYYLLSVTGTTTVTTPALTGSAAGPATINLENNITNMSNVVPGNTTGGTINIMTNTNTLPAGNTYKLTALTPGTITVDSTHSAAGCKASWFQVSNVQLSTTSLTSALANTEGTHVGTATLTMPADSTDDQTSCIGATLTIPFTLS